MTTKTHHLLSISLCRLSNWVLPNFSFLQQICKTDHSQKLDCALNNGGFYDRGLAVKRYWMMMSSKILLQKPTLITRWFKCTESKRMRWNIDWGNLKTRPHQDWVIGPLLHYLPPLLLLLLVLRVLYTSDLAYHHHQDRAIGLLHYNSATLLLCCVVCTCIVIFRNIIRIRNGMYQTNIIIVVSWTSLASSASASVLKKKSLHLMRKGFPSFLPSFASWAT